MYLSTEAFDFALFMFSDDCCRLVTMLYVQISISLLQQLLIFFSS